jgi:hypothetical protein
MQVNEIRDWFSYTKTFTFTTTNQVLPDTIPVQADADFILVKVMHTSSQGADTTGIRNGGALIQIKDQADGRDLMDGAVPLDSISGRADLPFILPYPHRFKRNNSIAITLTNQGTAAQVIRLTLSGYKAWPVRSM